MSENEEQIVGASRGLTFKTDARTVAQLSEAYRTLASVRLRKQQEQCLAAQRIEQDERKELVRALGAAATGT